MIKPTIYSLICLFVLVLSACSNREHPATETAGSLPDTTKHMIPAPQTSDDSLFVKQWLTEMARPNSRKVSYEMVWDSFFNSSEKNVPLFFRFMLFNQDESASEGCGAEIFRIFRKDSALAEQLIHKAKMVPGKYRNELLYRLSGSVCIDLHYEEYSMEKCRREFPFLFSDPALQSGISDCYSNWVD